MRYKIIITGPVGAGKTTAINALTNDKALKTDVPVSDATTSQRKKTTTVALDYGVVKLNHTDVAHVYGTPGQERFDFMWEILSEGAHGLIILLDNSRNYPFRDLRYYSHQFSELIQHVPVIIGVTKADVKSNPDIKAYKEWVAELDLNAEVNFVDARNKEHIEMLVANILSFENEQIADDGVLEPINGVLEPIIGDTATLIRPETVNKTDMKDADLKIDPDNAMDQDLAGDGLATASATITLTEESMAAVSKINGVTGASLSNDLGELIDSTILDDDLNEFIAFLSGITPSIEDAAKLGKIHRIMLRGPKDDNLTIFVEAERSLGVTSQNKTSVPALSQQIEDMLQWM